MTPTQPQQPQTPPESELTRVIKSVENQLKPDSVDNKFVAHFFNRYPADINPDIKQQIMHGIPHEITSSDMDDAKVQCKPDMRLWIETASKNTDSENLYVVQINSFEDLKKRIEISRVQASKLNERLAKDVESLNKYKKTCDDDLQAKISDAHRKNEIISQKMISVYGKFEEYLSNACSNIGSRGLVKAGHDQLNQKYEDQLNQIQDPRAGLLKKLRDLQTRIKLGMQNIP